MGREGPLWTAGTGEWGRTQQGVGRGKVFEIVTQPPEAHSSQLLPDHLSGSQSCGIQLSAIAGKETWLGVVPEAEVPQHLGLLCALGMWRALFEPAPLSVR